MNLLSWHPLFGGNIRVPFILVITSKHLLFLKLPDLSVCLSSCLLPSALSSLDMFLCVSPSRSQSPSFHNISLGELSHHCQLLPFQTQLFLWIQRQMESLITFYRLGPSLENNQYAVLVIHSSSSSLPRYCRPLYPLQTQHTLGQARG